MKILLEAKNLKKIYTLGEVTGKALDGVSLTVKSGEFVLIMGRSGAGKSTLLHQLSLLDTPTSGQVILGGVRTTKLSRKEKTAFRLYNLGYVFQDYALMRELTAVENVALPLLMQGVKREIAFRRAAELLVEVGLGERENNLPSQLSGGEQQRVSVARAFVHDPVVVFADEPTANLDRHSAGTVMKLFKKFHENGHTIVMVSHEEEHRKLTRRVIQLDDGKIVIG